jgi:hypothetical protein
VSFRRRIYTFQRLPVKTSDKFIRQIHTEGFTSTGKMNDAAPVLLLMALSICTSIGPFWAALQSHKRGTKVVLSIFAVLPFTPGAFSSWCIVASRVRVSIRCTKDYIP